MRRGPEPALAAILVVVSEPTIARQIEVALTELGYVVHAPVASGEEALRAVATRSPDLVLMDIRIQGEMDGIETARLIRARHGTPVVYLMSHSDEATLTLRGAYGHVREPYTEHDLRMAVEIALQKRAIERQSFSRERSDERAAVTRPIAFRDGHSVEPAIEKREAAKVVSTAIPPTRRGRVLLVDDEPAIGLAIVRLLKRDHDVVFFPRAQEALARIDGGETFDVVFCDLMMPKMNGIEFFEAVCRQKPDLARRVVFLSGGAFTDKCRAFLQSTSNVALHKPVEAETLRRIVADYLRDPA